MHLIVLPCDGIGPDIVAVAIDVLKAAGGRLKLTLGGRHAEVA